MKHMSEFVVNALVGGLLVIVPIYLAVLLLLKGMQSVWGLVRPLAQVLPAWFPAENVLSLLLVLIVCFLVGVAIRTTVGRAIRERIERVFFERIPGYALLRSLTQRVAGESAESAWKPALAQIEEALVPAFIIEELEDGASQSLFLRYPRLLPEPSISSAGSVSIRWTSPLPRLSGPSPGGDPVQKILSQP
jgi:hypothetical protein